MDFSGNIQQFWVSSSRSLSSHVSNYVDPLSVSLNLTLSGGEALDGSEKSAMSVKWTGNILVTLLGV